LLVDTYDVPTAVKTAVELAGSSLGAVRIDSGDVKEVATSVRAQLDSLGATTTRIVVTGDLDEHSIAELAAAPIDAYGVGTALVTGSGAPTAALVYKLAARSADGGPVQPVAKRSVGKPTMGGRKWAARALDGAGVARAEIVSLSPPAQDPGLRPLLRQLVRDGDNIGATPLAAVRLRHARSLAELPPAANDHQPGGPAIPTVFEGQSPSGSDS
jgi:nicotinate phosphoribosyltransferase